MSTEKERLRNGAAAVGAAAGVAACFIGGYVLNRLGYVSIPGEDNSSGTKFPTTEPTQTPDFTSTLPPTLTSTLTSTLTPTPESGERTLIEKFLAEGKGVISDYPAFLNVLGVESLGVSQVNIDRFKDYFLQRELKVASGNTEIPRLDRMFGQLSLPVKNLSDRGLNFDWRNNGQGLGFDLPDFNVLRTLEQMKQVQEPAGSENPSPISMLDADGNYRAWTVANARDFEKVVLAYVDEYLRINGITNPATNPAVQGERRALFNRIVYGDLGVQAGDTDGLWQTVNDKFWIPCETHMANAQVRSEQSEAVRRVEFNPDQETENGGKEGDTTYVRDSDNSVLVAMVYSPADGYLRVEAYDLSDPPDPLNPGLDSTTRAFGGRWLPCGPGATATPTPGLFNSAPGETSTTIPPTSTLPEQPSPTSVPTNTEFPTPTATRGSLPTLEFTATTIPPTPVPTNTHYPLPTATQGPPPTLEPTATDIP